MSPKAKSDRVVTHRIEFQQTEREALEMVAASITARNVTASVGNLITPVLGASVAGVAAMLGLLAWWDSEGKTMARDALGTNPNTGQPFTDSEIANAIPGPHSTYTDPTRPGTSQGGKTPPIASFIEDKLQSIAKWISDSDTSGLL